MAPRLARHFAPAAPHEMLATSRAHPIRQQADLQRALDDLLGERRVPDNFVGVRPEYGHEAMDFARIVDSRQPVEIAPAQFEDIDIGGGESVRCLKNGLWMLSDGGTAYAVVLSQHNNYGHGLELRLEIVVPPGEAGAAITARHFDAIERRLSSGSCYRGRTLSFETAYQWSGQAPRIRVHELSPVGREDVVLPDATLAVIERNVLGFAAQRPALRALGLSTQKGLLFHGAPGTGKTHCVRYLASRLPDHTTLLIAAEEVAALPEYFALARLLQPALVVIEDADLIGRDRSARNNACDEVMLNRLLNELDGLREQADVFIVLTTNRPDTLEPALASRPGRVDQTIEFPLPDAAARERLVTLYARTLPVPAALRQNLAVRTAGASPAFIKELLRRVAQHHLESCSAGDVTAAIADAALHEMLFSGGSLNTRLLGGESVDQAVSDI